jgi:hypothetical protein
MGVTFRIAPLNLGQVAGLFNRGIIHVLKDDLIEFGGLISLPAEFEKSKQISKTLTA